MTRETSHGVKAVGMHAHMLNSEWPSRAMMLVGWCSSNPLFQLTTSAQAADTLKCTAAEAKADCEKISNCAWKVPTQQDLASITEQVTSLANSIKDAVTSKGGDASTSGNSATREGEIGSPISNDGACLPQSVSVADFVSGVSLRLPVAWHTNSLALLHVLFITEHMIYMNDSQSLHDTSLLSTSCALDVN